MAGPSWFWICGLAAVVAGLAILVRALVRDRSRGRRRCHRCWYDMSGVPGLRCPECGREAASEKRLHRTRRHWRRAGAGALITALGLATIAWPVLRGGGLTSALPTEVLILMMPPAHAETAVGPRGQLVYREIAARIDGRSLTRWQWSMLLERTGVVRFRPAWPRDRSVLVEVMRPAWLEGSALAPVATPPAGWAAGSVLQLTGPIVLPESRGLRLHSADGLAPLDPPIKAPPVGPNYFGRIEPPRPVRLSLGLPAGDRADVRLDVEVLQGGTGAPGPLWSGLLGRIRIVEDPAEAIPPCPASSAREIERGMRCVVRVRHRPLFAAEPAAEVGVQVERLSSDTAEGVAVGVRVQMLRDGEVFEEVEMLLTPGPLAYLHGPHGPGEIVSLLAPLPAFASLCGAAPEEPALDGAELARWSVRVVGDARIGVDDLSKTSFWPGERTWPLSEVYEPVVPTRRFAPTAKPAGSNGRVN